MKLSETGLTAEELKGLVKKYMIETYERFDFIAETAKDMYIYDEKGNAYLDFYAGIAVNSAGTATKRLSRLFSHRPLTLFIHLTILIQFLKHCLLRRFVILSVWIRFIIRIQALKLTRL